MFGWLVEQSPWLQLPVVLTLALPPAGAVAWAGLKFVDWVAGAAGGQRARRAQRAAGGEGNAPTSGQELSGATVVDHG